MTPDIIGKVQVKEYDPNNPHHEQTSYGVEGETVTHTFDNRFHVNFPKDVPELSDYKMNPQPSSPSRIYAGGIKPVCYRFDSEEQWDEVNPFKVEEDLNNA